MVETYKYLKRYTDEKYIAMANEELAKIYKEAKSENERSQAYGALFIKNFSMSIKIANRYDYVDSAEKASMVSAELLNSISDFDGSTKFITYYTRRIENLFLWEYTKRKKEINTMRGSWSIDEVENDQQDGRSQYSIANEYKCQLEDKQEIVDRRAREFYNDIDRMFERELKYCSDDSKESKSYRKSLELARKIVDIYKEDHTLTSDQVARILGLFRMDKKTGGYMYEEKPKAPDYIMETYKDASGKTLVRVREESHVKVCQWEKVQKINKFLKELFEEYGLAPKHAEEKSVQQVIC